MSRSRKVPKKATLRHKLGLAFLVLGVCAIAAAGGLVVALLLVGGL